MKKRGNEIKVLDESIYKLVFEGAGDGIVIADPATRKFVFANPEFLKLIGYPLQELPRLSVMKIHPKKDLSFVAEQFTKQAQGKITLAKDIPVLRKDKKIIYCDINSKLIKVGRQELLVGFFRDISERKKFVEELKKNEEKYKQLFESSSDAIMTLEPPTWRFTSANLTTIKIFGAKDEKEFLSLGPWNVSPERQPNGQISSDQAKLMIMKAMKEGSSSFEWVHTALDGKEFPATVLLTKVEIEKGKPFLQATVRDVTEIKKAEKDIVKAKEFSETILSTLSDGMDIVDQDLNIVYLNKTFLDVFGKQAIGKKCYKIYKDNKKQCADCPLKKPIKVGETRKFFSDCVAGGQIFEIIHTGMILPSGKKAVLEVFRNVTASIKKEHKIKYLKDYNENILESSPNPIIVLKGNNIEYVNKAFISAFGKNKKYFISKNLKKVISSEIVSAFEEILQNYDKTRELEFKGRNFNLSSFIVKEEEEEEEERRAIVMQDITERKRAEDNLMCETEKLERFKKATVSQILNLKFLEEENKKLKKEVERLGKK